MEEWYISAETKSVEVKQNSINAGGNIRWSPQFTLIGATTNDGLLSKPFRDRFKLRFLFTTYSIEESFKITVVHTERLNKKDQSKHINITNGAALAIAHRGRGVPRIIVGLLERCRDYAISVNVDTITIEETTSVFTLLKIDETGLNAIDIKILMFLYENNRPVGLDNLSVLLNESKQVLLETTEPYLVQRELMTRSGRGRVLTEKGRQYLIDHNYIADKEDVVFEISATYERNL